MSNLFSALSVQSAFDLAVGIMRVKGNANASKVKAQITQNGYDVSDSLVVGRSGTVPAFFVIKSDTTVVLGIDGISSVDQGGKLFASLSLPFLSEAYFSANAMVLQDARRVWQLVAQLYAGKSFTLLAAGYSYGGALAECVAALAVTEGGFGNIGVTTFGSPRPGPSSLGAVLQLRDVRRWMNENDPIPHFPPHASEAPLGTVSAGFPTAALIAQYVHPKGGLELLVGGGVQPADSPTLFVPIADLDLAGWFTGANGIAAAGHSIQLYSNQLGALVASLPSGATHVSGPGGPEQPDVLTKVEFDALQSLIDRMASLSDMKGSGKMAYIPPLYRPQVKFVTGTYQVIWMGHGLCATSTKSEAKTIAKYLFKFLRTFNEANTISISNNAIAWSAFWVVATSAANGFQPPFNAS